VACWIRGLLPCSQCCRIKRPQLKDVHSSHSLCTSHPNSSTQPNHSTQPSHPLNPPIHSTQSTNPTQPNPPNQLTHQQVFKRIPLIVRYTACGGLFNQHYSHIAALTLALALGGDVILPAAVKRDSFANYFSQDPTKNQVSWTAVPFDTLWDGEAVHGWLKGGCGRPRLGLRGVWGPALR